MSSSTRAAPIPWDSTYGQLDNMLSIAILTCRCDVLCCLLSIHRKIWETWESIFVLLVSSLESPISEYFSDILFLGWLVGPQSHVVSHTAYITSLYTVIPNFFILWLSDLPHIYTCIFRIILILKCHAHFPYSGYRYNRSPRAWFAMTSMIWLLFASTSVLHLTALPMEHSLGSWTYTGLLFEFMTPTIFSDLLKMSHIPTLNFRYTFSPQDIFLIPLTFEDCFLFLGLLHLFSSIITGYLFPAPVSFLKHGHLIHCYGPGTEHGTGHIPVLIKCS